MQRGFVIQSAWADASTLLKEVLTQHMSSATFLTKCLFELFRFIQFSFSGKKALRGEEN